jgi:transcriptional regulator with XRE-family HTH domain
MQIQEFRKRLNGFFNDSGMSKNALAKVTKISQSQVSNLANGKSKRWTKNTKKIDDFIQGYYQDNFKIPVKIEQILKQILIKSPENETQILTILEAINTLKLAGENGKK